MFLVSLWSGLGATILGLNSTTSLSGIWQHKHKPHKDAVISSISYFIVITTTFAHRDFTQQCGLPVIICSRIW